MLTAAINPKRRRGQASCAFFLALSIFVGLLQAPVAAHEQRSVRIGVIRSAAIPILDVDQKGFEAALAGSGWKEGVNVTFDVQTISSDPERDHALIQRFLAEKVDLIHSIGTGATRVAVKAAGKVPVVFSAVTDPVGAAIVPAAVSSGKPTGTNVTGVSDRWPVGLQLETYSKIVPHVKQWGTIYNPAEVNAVLQVKALEEAARKLGLDLVTMTVATVADVRPAALALAPKVQAIFLLSDSTVTSDYMAIQAASDIFRIPNFTGVNSSVARGALAAFGVDYFLVGYAAGKKAALVLRGGNPGLIPWDLAEHFGLVINQRVARSLGIAIPPDMLRIADKVLE